MNDSHPLTEQEALECHARGQHLQGEGRHSDALVQLTFAARFFDTSEGPGTPDLANVLADETESLLALCHYEEAEKTARQSKEVLEAIRDLLDPETRSALLPRAYGLWGQTLRELGRYQEANAPLLAAIELSSPDDLAGHLNNYGVLCKYWGKFDEGERTYLRALDLIERQFGENALEAATIYHNLGGLEHSRGDFQKGEPLARKAYEIRRGALGEDHDATIADAVAWGGLLDGLDRYSESVPIYRRAVQYYETRFGLEHFEVAATLNNLGMARAAQGDSAEARAALERCLAIKQKLFGENHPEVLLTRRNLSSVV